MISQRFGLKDIEDKLKATLRLQRDLSIEICKMTAPKFREQLESLSFILDTIPMLIFVKDEESNLIFVNHEAAQSGSTTVSEMEGTNSLQWWPADLVEKWKLDDQEVFRKGHAKRNIIEQIEIPSTGERRWVKTDKFPVFDDDGTVKYIMVCAVDINEMIPRALLQGRLPAEGSSLPEQS